MPDRDQFYDSPLADGRLQLQIVAIRWAMTVLYVVFALTGVIDVEGAWFGVSAGYLVAYHAYYTWHSWREIARTPLPPAWGNTIPFLDTVAVTLALLAIGDPLHPIWAAYFFVIVGVAFFYPSVSLPYTLWLVANYALLGAGIALRGIEVPAAYMLVAGVLLVLAIVDIGTFTGGERRLRTRLSTAARTDPLTGIPNRLHLESALEQQLQSRRRNGGEVAVLMLDIDYFKHYNTQFGHLAADAVLEQFAALLQRTLREGDIVARYGGDEFVIVLPDVGAEEGLALAERLRERVARSGICTTSIGVSAADGREIDAEALLREADAALMEAKSVGRNTVRAAVVDGAEAA